MAASLKDMHKWPVVDDSGVEWYPSNNSYFTQIAAPHGAMTYTSANLGSLK